MTDGGLKIIHLPIQIEKGQVSYYEFGWDIISLHYTGIVMISDLKILNDNPLWNKPDKEEISNAKKAVKEAGLYIAKANDIERLTEVAGDAYLDYPLHNWISNGKYDLITSKMMMHISLKSMMDNAVIFADSEEINGFAIWAPPGFTGIAISPQLFSETVSLLVYSGIGAINRLIAYEDYAMGLKRKYTANNDWYLHNICIKRSAQGKGIASKLMRPMLRFLDDRRVIAYLETNIESNVGLYQHYGFELMEKGRIPRSTVSHFAMLRKPVEN